MYGVVLFLIAVLLNRGSFLLLSLIFIYISVVAVFLGRKAHSFKKQNPKF